MLASPEFLRARTRGVALLDRVTLLPVTREMIARAGEMPERHNLRAYDSLHLSALMAAGSPREVELLCWNKYLRAAAAAEGYTVGPTWPGGVPPR